MTRLSRFILLLTLALSAARAAELTPVLQNHRLGGRLRALELPATLPKDLLSGLTNRLLIRISVFSGAQLLGQQTVDVTVKYDLWDEKFRLTMAADTATITSKTLSSTQEVTAFLTEMSVPGLFETTQLPHGVSTTLQADLLINPIEREQMEAIRKWVAENSTYTPSDTQGFGSDKRVGNPRSNAVFNKLFAQYADGTDVAASWRQTVASKPFRLEDLTDEPSP